MPKGTPVFAPTGFPPGGPIAYVLAGDGPEFTHDEFTVPNPIITVYLLHQQPAAQSVILALNGKLLSETIDYSVDYDIGEVTISATLHIGDKLAFRYAVGTIQTNAVARVVEHDVEMDPYPSITDTHIVTRQTPIAVSHTDTVDEAPLTIDDITASVAGYQVVIPADVDDGWESTVPAFTSAGGTVQVGNSAGELRSTFLRFDIPDLSPYAISSAYLELYPDANTASPGAKIMIQADASGVAISPVSKVDMDGRALTVAATHWQTPATTGSKLTSADISAVVAEVAAAGPTTSLLFILTDDGSATDEFLQIRSFTNSTGPAAALVVKFH